MVMHMPGAAPQPDRNTIAVKTPQKRMGLVPMQVGSQHVLAVLKGDEEVTVHVTARSREDHPRAAVVFCCLHERCKGKQWGTFAEMAEAHPQRTEMVKRGEIHLYGLWSNDSAAPAGKAKAAEEALATARKHRDKAQKAFDTLLESDKPESAAFLGPAQDRLRDATARAVEAERQLGLVKGVIGLLAPPERSHDE